MHVEATLPSVRRIRKLDETVVNRIAAGEVRLPVAHHEARNDIKRLSNDPRMP